jgi:hypothetical protein
MAKQIAKGSANAFAPTNADIARLAHTFFISEGSRDGHDMEHWLRAKSQLSNKLVSVTKTEVVNITASSIKGNPKTRFPHKS